MDDQVPEQSSEVVQAEAQTDEATSTTESVAAPDPAEEQRREQAREKAKENAAFAALRQREREAREEAARERAERQALMQRLMQGNAQPAEATQGDAPPDPAKYAGGEFNPDYVKDLTRYEARKLFQEHTATLTKQQQEQQALQARQQAVRNWETSQAAAQKKYPDFEVIVEAAAADIPQQAKVLMAGLKDGAELLYFASKDPEKARALTGSPVEVAAALGELRAEARYAAKLAAEKAAAETQTERPINPGNAGGRGSGEPDPRNTDAWLKWRAKQSW
jgi:hypothetical protein